MTISERLLPDLSECLPEINRCRDYHLYDGRGTRYLDMFLAGGTALLGHRPAGISQRVKNTMAKGLWTGYPTAWTGRLKKALGQLIPEFPEVYIFPTLFEAEEWLTLSFPGIEICDPAVDLLDKNGSQGLISLWRPFLPLEKENIRAVLPILPMPGSFPGIVCFPRNTSLPGRPVRQDDSRLPSYIMAGLVRSAVLLGSFFSGEVPTGGGNEKFPDKRKLELPGWEQRGPYLRYCGHVDEYQTCFKNALEEHILLPPRPDVPAVIPGLFSKKEIKPLYEIF